MKESPKCRDCGQLMFEVGGIGKMTEIGEYRKEISNDRGIWHQTGVREMKLYQCPEDKTIAIE